MKSHKSISVIYRQNLEPVIECPLCFSKLCRTVKLEKTSIVELWRKFGVDVSEIIKPDIIHKACCDNCGLGFYSPACPGDDAFYSKLADWDWYFKHQGKFEYKYAASLVLPGMNVIDVGCGIGEFFDYLPSSAKFVGVDVTQKSIEIGISLGRPLIQMDIVTPPDYFINKYDIVTCFQVLEHIADFNRFFFSLVELCKPGGLIVIAVPNNNGFVGSAINNALNMPPHHILLWNSQSLKYIANKFKLEVVSCFDERISDVHRQWGFTVVINRFLIGLLGIAQPEIDHSLFARIVNKVSAIIAFPLSKILPRSILAGHSSIIVLRKPVND